MQPLAFSDARERGMPRRGALALALCQPREQPEVPVNSALPCGVMGQQPVRVAAPRRARLTRLVSATLERSRSDEAFQNGDACLRPRAARAVLRRGSGLRVRVARELTHARDGIQNMPRPR